MKLLRADLAISSWWPKDSLCSWNNVRARTAPNLWEKREDNPSMRDPKRRIRDHHEVSYDCMRQERKGQQDDPIRRTAPHRGTNGLMVTTGLWKAEPRNLLILLQPPWIKALDGKRKTGVHWIHSRLEASNSRMALSGTIDAYSGSWKIRKVA